MMQQLLTSLGAGVSGDQATFIGRRYSYTGGPSNVASSASGPGVSSGTDSRSSWTYSSSDTESMNTKYTWTCPTGVTQVSILCIGGGGGGQGGGFYGVEVMDTYLVQYAHGTGGGGGGLVYLNHLTVTPGTVYHLAVGAGGPGTLYNSSNSTGYGGQGTNGGTSWFATAAGSGGGGGTSSNQYYSPSTNFIKAIGGGGGGDNTSTGYAGYGQTNGTAFSSAVSRSGGTGANGPNSSVTTTGPGSGGGAAGYSGNGGNGSADTGANWSGQTAGAGGGGSGGGGRVWSASGGGGVGAFGEGASGAAATTSQTAWPSPYSATLTNAQLGQGGSGGEDSGNGSPRYYGSGNYNSHKQVWDGGLYGGGGGGGGADNGGGAGGCGAPGIIRILWAEEANYRYYPNTNTTDM